MISMSVLRHSDADVEKRYAYLKMARAQNREAEEASDDAEVSTDMILSDEEFAKMQAEEEFVLTVTDSGYGKRTSAYEYRITGRGGQGVTSIDTTKRKDSVVASFPVTDAAHVMLVTDAGKLIRMPVKDIRIAGRNTVGVIMFRLSDAEHVVSATCIEDYDDEDIENAEEAEEVSAVEATETVEGE